MEHGRPQSANQLRRSADLRKPVTYPREKLYGEPESLERQNGSGRSNDRYIAMMKHDILALGRYWSRMNALSGGNQVHCHVKSVQKIRASKEKTEDMSLLHIENALTRCVYASETDSDKSLEMELEDLLGRALSRMLRSFQKRSNETNSINLDDTGTSSVYCRSILLLLETAETCRRKMSAAVFDRERMESDMIQKLDEMDTLKEQVVLLRDLVERCKRPERELRSLVPQDSTLRPQESLKLKEQMSSMELIVEERAFLVASLRQENVHLQKQKQEADTYWSERCQKLQERINVLQSEKENFMQQTQTLRVQLDLAKDEYRVETLKKQTLEETKYETAWKKREKEILLSHKKSEDGWIAKLELEKKTLDKSAIHQEKLERQVAALTQENDRLAKKLAAQHVEELRGDCLQSQSDEYSAEINRYKTLVTESEREIAILRASLTGKEIQLVAQAAKLASTEQQLTNAAQQRIYQTNLLQELECKLHQSIPNDQAHEQLQIENEKKWNQRLSAIEHLLALEKQNAAILKDQQQVTLSIERDKVVHATKQMRVMANELETANLCLAERKKQREKLEAELVALRTRDGLNVAHHG